MRATATILAVVLAGSAGAAFGQSLPPATRPDGTAIPSSAVLMSIVDEAPST